MPQNLPNIETSQVKRYTQKEKKKFLVVPEFSLEVSIPFEWASMVPEIFMFQYKVFVFLWDTFEIPEI